MFSPVTLRRVACVLALACVVSVFGQGRDYRDHAVKPEGRLGEVVRALITVVNANDPAAFLAFLDEHAASGFRGLPDEQHVAVYRSIWGESRGVDYHGYRTYDPPRTEPGDVVIVKDRLAGSWRAFVIVLDAEGRIDGLQYVPARRPTDLPPPAPLPVRGAMAEIDAYVGRLAAADAFSGTVLVARNGTVLYERALGEASKRFHVPNDLDTKFNLGSMNKMFTAVAIAQLVESGQLSFDDTLDQYVDETWLAPEVSAAIRIRHLLNHTSGLGSYFTPKFFESSRASYRALDDYKPLIVGSTLAFEPGTDWRYSNTGMFLLGVVIERVTGSSYFDHVRQYIHEPAGMTNTDCYEMDRPVENLAIGYIPEYDADGRQVWKNNLYMHVIKGGPAGGGFSTVRDLHRFDVALRSGRLASAARLEELWTPRPEAHSPDYGYGFGVETGPQGRVVGHGGGFPGLNGQLDMFLDTGWTVAVLSNYDRGAQPVAGKI
ncbi:MAG: beta-lactamase family protein, partial [Phycisphaerae bacterium]|nr:beta-lactamase family protein [Phycisphaerae bacterium]